MKNETLMMAIPWLFQGFLLLLFLINVRRMELRVLPLAIAALAGLALMALLVFPQGPLVATRGSVVQGGYWEEYRFFLSVLIFTVACYLVAGFVAGALSRWRGGTYGTEAGGFLLVLTMQQFFSPVVSLIQSRSGLWIDRNSSVEPRLYFTMAVVWILFLAVSALGGRLGQKAGLALKPMSSRSVRPPASHEGVSSAGATSRRCPHCGAAVPAGHGVDYCSACGAPLAPTA